MEENFLKSSSQELIEQKWYNLYKSAFIGDYDSSLFKS